MPHLLQRGWAGFGDPLPQLAAGRLQISQDRLQLIVDEQALLVDENPYAPDGWWAAVDQMQGRCVVVIVRDGDVDLTRPEAGEQLAALMGTGRAATAALPVEIVLDA